MSHLFSIPSERSRALRPQPCPAPRRRAQALALVAMLITVGGAMVGCAEDLPFESPGDDVLMYFPRSLTVHSSNPNTVYLVNANADQRFDAGWVSAIDVGQVVQAINANTSGAPALSKALRVPRMGGPLVFRDDGGQAYLTHYATGILTVIDIEPGPTGPVLSCGDTDDRSKLPADLLRTSCDRFHLVDLVDQAWQQDTTRKRTDFLDPSSVAVIASPTVGAPPTLVTSYTAVQWLSTLNVSTNANPTMERAAAATLAAPTFASPATSIRHMAAVPGEQSVYAAGKAGDGSALMRFDLVNGQLTAQQSVNLGASGGSTLERLLVSPKDANVIYAINRYPDQIITLRQVTRQAGLGTTASVTNLQAQPEVVSLDGSQPFDMTYAQRSLGDASRSDIVAVVGVAKNTVYFLETTPVGLRVVGRLPLESDRILSSSTPALEGGGPAGLAYVDVRKYGTALTDLLFVTNYFSHTLSVIDMSMPHASAFKEVLRIEGNNLGPSLRYP